MTHSSYTQENLQRAHLRACERNDRCAQCWEVASLGDQEWWMKMPHCPLVSKPLCPFNWLPLLRAKHTHRCRRLDFMLLSSPRQGHIAVAPLPIISVCSDNSSIHNFTQISFLRHLSPENKHTHMRVRMFACLKHMYTQGRKTLRHKPPLMSISFMTNGLKSISRIRRSFTHPFSSA